jgi:hypothetical protein
MNSTRFAQNQEFSKKNKTDEQQDVSHRGSPSHSD